MTEIEDVIQLLKSTFPAGKYTPDGAKAAILLLIAERLKENTEELVRVTETLENIEFQLCEIRDRLNK